jgi:NADPH:quinone reductase-like Zn-dependent oxidoreductase
VKRHFRQYVEPRANGHDATPAAAPHTQPQRLPTRTRAVVIERYGAPEVLSSREIPLASPGPGEVTLRHTAIGVNYIDVYCRTGYFGLVAPPGVPGLEAAGIVMSIGPGVNGLMPGDRVAYASLPPGAYSEWRTMPADLLVLLPDDIDDEEAAAGMLKGMTAEFLLHRIARVVEGDTVLVHAAAGGVGLLLCQWARALGATVLGTVSSEEKARLARAHGCSYPILYGQEDVAARVMEITNAEGCRVVFDAVGRDTIPASIASLGIQGHLVSYGQASGHIEAVDVAGLAAKSLTVSRPNFGHYTDTPAKVRSITDRLFDAHRRGIVHFDPHQRFPLAEAAAAHRALESRETVGATILIP